MSGAEKPIEFFAQILLAANGLLDRHTQESTVALLGLTQVVGDLRRVLDSLGQAWSADSGFNTGSAFTGMGPIAETSDPALYQSERWDAPGEPELTYALPVTPGSYTVRLHFADTGGLDARAGGHFQ